VGSARTRPTEKIDVLTSGPRNPIVIESLPPGLQYILILGRLDLALVKTIADESLGLIESVFWFTTVSFFEPGCRDIGYDLPSDVDGEKPSNRQNVEIVRHRD
jgi:hypothetical protein